MVKRASPFSFIKIELDADSKYPLFRQLYSAIRTAILTGQLKPGSRIPASRELAESLGVSRNTVVSALEQLAAEGYVEGRTGSGSYVSRSLSQDLPSRIVRGKSDRRISQRGLLLARTDVTLPRSGSALVPFRPGVPALREFPFALWARIASKAAKRLSLEAYAYSNPAGYLPLRKAICEYLQFSRSVRCTVDQVIIVSGSQQALDLAGRILVDPGDGVIVEDPGYIGSRGAFAAAGATLIAQNVDQEGISIPPASTKARLICVTPSHQYPLGVTMSLHRRLEVLDWAKKSGAWVFEDDYDSEYRFSGRPLAAMQGLDEDRRVMYCGTFSKVLFPGVRLGYLVVPEDLIDPFVSARALVDRHPPAIQQAVVAEFIEEGHFVRHIKRMRDLYNERRDMLIHAIQKRVEIEIQPSECGMHLIGWLDQKTSDRMISRNAAAIGIDLPPLSGYCLQRRMPPGLLFGYAAFNNMEMQKALLRLFPLLKGRKKYREKERVK